jgi:predicted ATPase/DNA-binding CsgD family transcriptional regulator
MCPPGPRLKVRSVTANARSRHNLPTPSRPLVGRAAELAQLLAHLRDPACRLVTVAGPGGAGKTRLALAAALALAPAGGVATPFSAGVFLAPLSALEPATGAEGLATVIADVLGIDLGGEAPSGERLAAAIGERPLLLLLDTCEHLAELPAFVTELLLEAAELTVLATSRSRLGIRGEWVIPLQGLPAPPELVSAPDDLAHYDAVRLFVDSARAVTPAFRYSSSVAAICRQVGGLPLGIELAASWTPVLSCEEIAAEIGHNLDFLAAELNDLPARQQSLRAVFSSSWSLLTPDEQRAARRMACFQGEFSRAAAAAVAGAGLPVLGGLIKKSLVLRVDTPEGGGTRYTLVGPLRPYAAEQLAAAGETAMAEASHTAHYLGWLAGLPDALRGPGQQAVLAAIGVELAEVRAAWRRAVEARDGAALGAAAEAIYLFCTMRSHFHEGAELLLGAAEALDPAAAPLAAGRLLGRAGWCVFQLGRPEEARALLERSVDLLRGLGAGRELAVPLNALASLARFVGAYDKALALAHEGLALSAATGDAYGVALTATTLSQTSYAIGRYDDARRYAEQSIAAEQGLGNRWGSAFNLITLGQIARAQGDLAAARGHFQAALAIRDELNDSRGMALCLNELGDTALALGERDVAGRCYEQSLTRFQAVGNVWGEIVSLRRLGQLAQLGARPAAARRLFEEALRKAESIGAAHEREGARAAIEQLGDASPGLAGAAGPTLRQALDEALAVQVAPVPAPPASAVAAGARRPPPGEARVSLTAREVEVLRLVAGGLTDAQVAEQLFLSPRTVGTYLSSIYGKLQVRSRSAATRWAITNGVA